MKMKIYNSNKNFYRESYPIDLNIQYISSYRTFDLEFNYQDQILYQSFETNAKFLGRYLDKKILIQGIYLVIFRIIGAFFTSMSLIAIFECFFKSDDCLECLFIS